MIKNLQEGTEEGRRRALDLTSGPAKAEFEEMRSYLDQLQELNLANADKAHVTAKKIYKNILIILISIMVLGILAGIFFTWITSLGIVRPINRAVDALNDIAGGEGDLTARIDIHSRDEVGKLAEAFNTFMIKLQGVIRLVAESVNSLNGASDQLTGISERMVGDASGMSTRSDEAVQNSGDVQKNMESLAVAAQQLSATVSTMASAVEEMTVSVAEIAQNASSSAETTSNAARIAGETNSSMDTLLSNAQSIGQVVDVIVDISEQTKLLALNATI